MRDDEVPWLDDDEQAVWLRLVGVLVHLPAALDAQLRADSALSHFEYQILAGLSMAEGRSMRMSDMEKFTESSLSRLSHACARLERHGWVARTRDAGDGRVTVASLTDAGHATVVEAAPGHVRAVRALVFDPLTDAEVRQLGRIAARIDDGLQSTAGGVP
jgi:DNA-binding MarR family transcriptional regulator